LTQRLAKRTEAVLDERPVGHLDVCLADDHPDGSLVARVPASRTDPPVIDPGSERVSPRCRSGGHNGGCSAFGNDVGLHTSNGDGDGPSPS
jgi:hypothetical protein